MTTYGELFNTFLRLLRSDRKEAQRWLLRETQKNPHTPNNLSYFAGYCNPQTVREVREALREFGAS
jgi:hypothetical protein